jgi:hypothetical protein
MREVAKHLEAMGRHGDTALVHMSPQEVSALHGIASINGTHLTRNPHTGLPEAFNLGGFFKSLLPTIVGAVAAPLTGGTSMLIPVMAGAATGAALNGKDPLMGALMGGLGGYGGAGIGNALGASGAASGATSGAAGANSLTTPTVSTAMESGSMIPGADAMSSASAMGKLTSFMPDAGAAGAASQAAPTFGQMGQGIANLGNSAGRDAFIKSLGGTGPNADLMAAGKVAMPLGMAGLAGIEPPKMPQEKEDKYDPYATLNLNTDSGLRFFAEGGDVKNVQSASGPPALRDAVNRINNSPNPVASALLGNFDTNSLRSSPNPGVDLFRAMTMGGLGRMGDINNMYRPESLGLFAKDSGARFAEGGDVNETPDPGSNPIQDAQEAQQFGLGGLAYAGGGGVLGGSSLNLGEAPSGASTGGFPNNYFALANPSIAKLFNYNMSGRAEQPVQAPSGEPTGGFPNNYFALANPSLAKLFNYNMSGSPSPFAQSDSGPFAGSSGAKFAKGGYLDGPGDGMSDSIPATIEGKQPARLADGEFVVPADVVSHLGNGSTKAGAQRLYSMMDKVRHARTGTTKQGRQINPKKYLPA